MPTASGLIFNIQKFSIHDGPGIRTLVFFKGCPLRCPWCCNPESQNPFPEHGYRPDKCFGCGRCVARCSRGFLSLKEDRTLALRRGLCRAECPDCVKVCPDQALVFYGRSCTVPEVLDLVEQDALFYSRSGGGLTVSGGEPFAQPDFLLHLLREARHRGLDTALESCGYAPEATFLSAMPHVSYLMVDIKHMDDETHRNLTGVSNATILGNLEALRRNFPRLPLKIRTPVIPGLNDTEENLLATRRFALGLDAEYELLEYHRLGVSKYASLGRDYPLGDATLDGARFASLQKKMAAVH